MVRISLGLEHEVVFAVARLFTSFEDKNLEIKTGSGTGFWVSVDHTLDSLSFVTNRHNLDLEMIWRGRGWRLVDSRIEVRRFTQHANEWQVVPHPETSMLTVDPNVWRLHDTADCAAAMTIDFEQVPPEFKPAYCLTPSDIATESWVARHTGLTQVCSFVGFPGSGDGKPWFDEHWKLPIARTATLASNPSIQFTNQQIRTKNVALVSGLSLAGSSGSPLIVHEVGDLSGALDYPQRTNYQPAKLIGIMSGHFREPADEPPMFQRHTGLSYYTRASAVCELIGLDPVGTDDS